MIPPEKLSTLTRSHKLRKAAKIFGDAEHRFIVSGKLDASETGYLSAVLELLINDEEFSPPKISAFKTAQANLGSDEAANNPRDIRRALNTVHQILLAETGRYQSDWDFIEPGGALDPAKRRPFPGMMVYLEDIRSPFNVGSMFRAAESFGAEKIWLSPLAADPLHKRSSRTAMGCVDVLPWERLAFDPFTEPGKTALKESSGSACNFAEAQFFTMETGGIPLSEFRFPARGILIAGSEELGVSPGALAAADSSLGRVTIPVYGAKGSLNVSVAFGIVMQAWAAYLVFQALFSKIHN